MDPVPLVGRGTEPTTAIMVSPIFPSLPLDGVSANPTDRERDQSKEDASTHDHAIDLQTREAETGEYERQPPDPCEEDPGLKPGLRRDRRPPAAGRLIGHGRSIAHSTDIMWRIAGACPPSHAALRANDGARVPTCA